MTADAAAGAGLRAPLGQGAALAELLRLARARRLPHAVLIEGPAGIGKSTVLRWLAAALFCPSELDREQPCGNCRHCRRVASAQHPDLHLVAPPEDKRAITIDQVRELQAVLQRHAVEDGPRVVLLDPLDHVQEDAQNTLLKTLEEPGDGAFLLLATARAEELLPTVHSRVRRLRVQPLAEPLLRQELSRLQPERNANDWAVRHADGCLGTALELGTEQAVLIHDLVRAVLADVKRLRSPDTVREILQSSKGRDADEVARLFLRILRCELRDRLRQALEGAAPPHYSAATSATWTGRIECTLAAERDLALRIPAEQALCGCLLQM